MLWTKSIIFVVAAVQTASKSLMEAISDVYETHWTGAEALVAQTQSIDALWQDFSHKLGDQVLIPLNTYTAQFPEMKVLFKLHHSHFFLAYMTLFLRKK